MYSFLIDVQLCDVLLDKLDLEDIGPLTIQRNKHNAARDFIWIFSAISLNRKLIPLTTQINASKFQNLSQIPLKIRGVRKIVVFDLKLTQIFGEHHKNF